MIKVGKYTAALILVVVGGLLLVDLTTNSEIAGELVNWWPAMIILLGVEYLILSTIYRSPDQKIGFAVGSLILSVVLSVGVIGYTSFSSFSFSSFNFGDIPFSDKSGKSYDKGTTIVPVEDKHNKAYIHNPHGEISVLAGNVEDIEIKTTLYVSKLKNDEADAIAEASSIEFLNNDDTIELEANGKEYRIFGIKQYPRMDMIVTVPADKEMDYEIAMTNGKLHAEGITVIESFDVKTTNGAIIISDIQAKVVAQTTNGNIRVESIRGDVQLDTTNGTITATDVDGDLLSDTTNGKVTATRISGIVEADTTNGSITITEVIKDVAAETTNGRITVRTSTLGGDWELETSNGDIEIYLPEQANFEVDGNAASYKTIHSDFQLNVSKGEVTGRIGTSEHEINMDTNSGISIYKNR